MPPPPLVVIGAGLAGLATGCYARLNGYTTRIFEHHSQPGGVVAAWRRGDYLIDGGIHFLIGYRPGQPIYELYRELGIAPTLRAVPMETYVSFLDERSGRALAVTADLDRLEADLKQASPAASAVIAEILEGARRFATHGLGTLEMGRPAELTGPLDRLRLLGDAARAAHFSGWYALSVSDYVQRRTGHPGGCSPTSSCRRCRQFNISWARWPATLPCPRGRRELVEPERRYRDLRRGALQRHGRGDPGGRARGGVRLADGTIHRATAVAGADGRDPSDAGGRYLDDQSDALPALAPLPAAGDDQLWDSASLHGELPAAPATGPAAPRGRPRR